MHFANYGALFLILTMDGFFLCSCDVSGIRREVVCLLVELSDAQLRYAEM